MNAFRNLLACLFFSVFAVACTKEEPVQPCGTDAHQVVNTKNTSGAGIGTSTGNAPPDGGLGSGDTGGTTSNQGGISDDGDDIADSEKTRKKRR